MRSAATLRITRIADSHVQHLGPFDGRAVLVVVGRQNQLRRSAPIDAIAAGLHGPDLSVCWHERPGALHARLREQALDRMRHRWLGQLTADHPHAGRLALKTVRLVLKMRYPKRRAWVGPRLQPGATPPDAELADFARHLRARQVFLLGHSAGGRLASLLDAEPKVTRLVCFGYPFKHPDLPEEPARTAHLPAMTKPFLILQGDQDSYGTPADAARYALSPTIVLEPIAADHDYAALSPQQIMALTQRIRRFLGLI